MGDNDVLYVVEDVVLFLLKRVFGFGRDGIRASFRSGTNLLHNLLSVSQLCSAGCTVIFKHHNSKIVCPSGDVIPVEEKDGLYFVPLSSGSDVLRSVSMPKLFANLARACALKKKLDVFNGVVSNDSVCGLLDKEELEVSAAYRKPPALRYWKHTRSLEGARNAARASPGTSF